MPSPLTEFPIRTVHVLVYSNPEPIKPTLIIIARYNYFYWFTFLQLNFFPIFKDLLIYVLSSISGSVWPDDKKPIIISTISKQSLRLLIVCSSLIISAFSLAPSLIWKRSITEFCLSDKKNSHTCGATLFLMLAMEKASLR